MEFEPDYADTDPRALEVMYDLQRNMPPGEKATLALQLSGMLLRLAEAGVRSQYPAATEEEVLVRVAARHLDPDTVTRVYGWCPDGAHPEMIERRQEALEGVATPEDIILAKLSWFRKGGSVSARQWNDVLGVVRIQGDRLDRAYLNDWAERLGVRELLDDALRQGSTSLSEGLRRPGTP
jgi:hypothetical protein